MQSSAPRVFASVSRQITVTNRFVRGKTIGRNLIRQVINLLTDVLHKDQAWMKACCSYVIMIEWSIVDLLTTIHRKVKVCETQINSAEYTQLGRVAFYFFAHLIRTLL